MPISINSRTSLVVAMIIILAVAIISSCSHVHDYYYKDEPREFYSGPYEVYASVWPCYWDDSLQAYLGYSPGYWLSPDVDSSEVRIFLWLTISTFSDSTEVGWRPGFDSVVAINEDYTDTNHLKLDSLNITEETNWHPRWDTYEYGPIRFEEVYPDTIYFSYDLLKIHNESGEILHRERQNLVSTFEANRKNFSIDFLDGY
ncbi:MAG: hypothetical protein GWO41_11620 [candidate division Zixibacteria bacterium]|nr:hypothetical protein [candidate division Zixibacteria bacterium]NIR63195.1 hypothetical protein [candidate division Zixibacteria bacterium]NIS16979.1 hypothetical protein [candidate division Zixibacteria bacterium]NIS45173.1 hypothetical protein [candidate division Zixibacteria bacterium]NIT53357.1 hypothetical protein [candidate division Zixibacteria bacterium]